MQSEEIRKRFLSFFEKRGHAVLPSASLVPENDPSVLFNTAGMQPLVPYLLGEEHPKGKRLVDIQKCVRTGDIDDVGDNRHLTFFEMMGNWSLGDYFKKEAISWSYEFLTSKDEGLGLNPDRLYVTIFKGDDNAPFDEESKEIWMSLGIPENRIYPLGADDNWWSPGDNGPSGPDSEMFYDLTEKGLGDLSKDEFLKAVEEETLVEIWNDVFMEYEKKAGKVIGKLKSKNVDTGAGLERITAVMQGKTTAYDTDLFEPIISRIRSISSTSNEKAERVVADHVRTAVFMIADGVTPSNTDRGYILRRLLRRAVRYADMLGIAPGELFNVADAVISKYQNIYTEISKASEDIDREIREEEEKFRKTLEKGIKILDREMVARNFHSGENLGEIPDLSPIDGFAGFTPIHITGKWLFNFYQTFGFPFELAIEELQKDYPNRKAREFFPGDIERFKKDFDAEYEKHQELSRKGAEQKFKGGLADTSEMSVKYHTATHLLHQALHDVLGDEVGQKGSNITSERLRFDFSFPRKMTPEEIERVENIVNQKISEALPVNHRVMDKAEAERTGARHFFDQKYPDQVSVYFIGETIEDAYSKEFCGGPHVANTGELYSSSREESRDKEPFKIIKEEAVSAGVRRIKAVLE
jgi:alanyl-tRNA synthetase